ncbi:MAG: 30S ribosomal protein S20 [Proteobacteria bacterium]|nr:30S ribosomal protein S20 [Pseudomonadota bacterium]
MANTAQATKRAHQSQARAEHNGAQRSRFRTAVKNLRKNIESKNHQEIDAKDFQATVSIIDKSVTKGLIHPNKAARLKSRLNRNLRKKVTK